MNTKLSIWLLLALVFNLGACADPGKGVTIIIAQPLTDLATNSNVPLKLEIPNFNPDQFSTLTVVIERKKTTDPDTGYIPIKVFEKTDPYPFAFTWNPSSEQDGVYTLRAKATYQLSGFGGSSTTSSATRSVSLDRTAPTIVDRTPAADAKEVSVRAPINITFSELIASGSLTEDSVKLSGGGTVLARKLERSSDGKTLTITPSSTLKASGVMQLEFGDGVTDTTGNKLVPKSWSWSAPAWIRLGELRSSVPGVKSTIDASFVVGKDGNPMAVWRGTSGSGPLDLYVSQWDGTKWVALGGNLRLLEPGVFVGFHTTICLDANGVPFVEWEDYFRKNVFVYRWDGTSWQRLGTGLLTTQPNLKNAFNASFTLDSSGAPVVGWEASTDVTDERAAFISRWDGTNWQALGGDLRALIPGTKFATSATPVLDGDKNLLAFWSGGSTTLAPQETFLYQGQQPEYGNKSVRV
jgi:Bacterial Ig-like domain